MVEVVGRDGLHAAACHRHGRIGFEACHAQEGDERACDVLAHATTVSVVHLQVVQGEAFALTHRDAGVADVVGHPVGQHGYFLQVGLLAAYQFVHLALGFGDGGEAAVVFVDAMEPARLLTPVGSGGHHQFGGSVVEVYHVGLAPEGHQAVRGKGVDFASVLVAQGRGAAALVELKLHVLLGRQTDTVDFAHRRVTAPEGHDVVELAAHGRDEA